MSISQWIKQTAVCVAAFSVPLFASAHEVYVLSHAEIASDMTQAPLNLFAVAVAEKAQFALWGMIGILAVIVIFGVSISYGLQKHVSPFLLKIKPYASHIAQITLGVSLIASAYHHALFGPELPLDQLFGGGVLFVQVLLYLSGAMVLFGFLPRIGSAVVLAVFAAAMVNLFRRGIGSPALRWRIRHPQIHATSNRCAGSFSV